MSTARARQSDLLSTAPNMVRSPAALANILNDLDVTFIQTEDRPANQKVSEPIILLASLAANCEARLRSAIIPLLLRHPEFAEDAAQAARRLADPERSTLICFYTAAVLLQRKHAGRLATLGVDTHSLPHHFFEELGLASEADPDEALYHLATRHRLLSGKAINWLGTYEHAAERWLTHMERRRAWAT